MNEENKHVIRRTALSTHDNPFNPFKDFNSWFEFDLKNGYNCCSLLSRISQTAEMLTDKENQEEIERAIDEIIKEDFLDIYIKVVEEEQISDI